MLRYRWGMTKNPQDVGPRLLLAEDELKLIGRRIDHHRNTFHLRHPEADPMSQDTLATKIGISRPTLASYLSGHRRPPVRVVQDIAFVLDIAPELITPHARRVFADTTELAMAS